MSNRCYWADCIADAASDCGAELTKEQIDCIANWIERAHDSYGMATGLDVANRNFSGNQERVIADLNAKLVREKSKILCSVCSGRGSITSYGGTMQCTSACWKCNGDGRVVP